MTSSATPEPEPEQHGLAGPPRRDRVGASRTPHGPDRRPPDRDRSGAGARTRPTPGGLPRSVSSSRARSSRAADTARLAGFDGVAVVEPDLREWDYGALEGRLTAEIREDYPGWSIWTGPWPEGETVEQVGARADRVLARIRAADGDVLVFSHGHLLRVLAARWLGLPPASGALFALSTATVSILGWDRENAVIETWNEDCHLA